MLRKVILTLLTLLSIVGAAATVTGCNTMEGAGKEGVKFNQPTSPACVGSRRLNQFIWHDVTQVPRSLPEAEMPLCM
jgi:predicted small secreted protein